MPEPARSTLAGFALTGANYEEAVRVLKKRYGKGTAIQQAHVNDLLSLPPAYSDRDTPQLRRLYDRCETHHRRLIALGVNENTFRCVRSKLRNNCLVIPKLMSSDANLITASPSTLHVGTGGKSRYEQRVWLSGGARTTSGQGVV